MKGGGSGDTMRGFTRTAVVCLPVPPFRGVSLGEIDRRAQANHARCQPEDSQTIRQWREKASNPDPHWEVLQLLPATPKAPVVRCLSVCLSGCFVHPLSGHCLQGARSHTATPGSSSQLIPDHCSSRYPASATAKTM